MECWAERLMWWGWEFNVASDDVMLVPGPTFHMSFCSLCLCALYRGARLRIVERFDVAGSYDELRETCTWSFLVPTMSSMMLELWRDRLEGSVVAIGNAPTALFRLLEMVEEGAGRPAAVLGIPVGFIGAAESKQALAEHRAGLEYLVVHGRRGGSAMTAAAVNAIASEDE